MTIRSLDTFLALLKSVHLGGVIDQCVVEVRKGVAHVCCADMSNFLFVKVSQPVESDEEGKMGLENLSLLCKIIESQPDLKACKILFKGDKLTVSGSGKESSTYRIATAEPDIIPTVVDESQISQLMKTVEATKKTGIKLEMDTQLLDKVIRDTGLLPSESIGFFSNKDGVLCVGNRRGNDGQLEIKTKTKVKESGHEFAYVYSDQLISVLKLINSLSEKVCTLHIAEGSPVVVTSEKQLWVISNID